MGHDPSCECNFDKNGEVELMWAIAIPIITLFGFLNTLGIINIFRFCRLKGFTASLFFIYLFSFTEQIGISLYLAFIFKETQYNYVQY